MSYKIELFPEVSKKLLNISKKEKKEVRAILDIMMIHGTIGEPIISDLNIWRYRKSNIRIFYIKKANNIKIIKLLNDIDYEKNLFPSDR